MPSRLSLLLLLGASAPTYIVQKSRQDGRQAGRQEAGGREVDGEERQTDGEAEDMGA